MPVPSWVQDAVFYQIFPDRFANGDPANDPPNVQRWDSRPTIWGFQGGDLRGIIKHFDYLLDLGVNALYLNPIFQASSSHRYNTTDYYRIDPKLGTMEDFHALLKLAHRHNMHVVLDGVFNHCGRGFFAFTDILENGENSPYRDWFHINDFPVDAYSDGPALDYVAWWGIKSLPKFNTDNPQVRRYLLDVARYWIEQGADGWRLDVPNEINDDVFWAEFRQIVKSANPEAYILGEIWTPEKRWVGEGHFDGLMHYPIRDAVLRLLFAGTLDIPHFADKVESLLRFYPRDNVSAMYVLLGSHDTERLLTKVEGSVDKAKLAFLFQFAYPGAPAIYYGDEIGMRGGKDPDCRATFPWEESQWNTELRDWVKKLVSIRKRRAVLRRGEYLRLCADSGINCLAFARLLGDEKIVVVVNASPEKLKVSLPVDGLGWPDGQPVRSLLSRKQYAVEQGKLAVVLPPLSGDWIG